VRPVEAEQGGTGAGERRIESGVLIELRSHQMSLDVTQKGILRKDDSFEVIFDPEADEREKGVLGKIVLEPARRREVLNHRF
jgi:hypothetical protein